MLKRCFKCQKDLPRSDFYTHPAMKDGLLGKCKACTRSDVKKHRRGPARERVLAYDRERAQTPERRTAALEQQRKQRAKHPEKFRARLKVHRAVKAGQLERQSCSRCGSTKGVEGHHHDYSKPLDVIWLCGSCHVSEHHEAAP